MVYSLAVKRIGGRYPAVFITRKVFFYGLLTILPVFAFQPFSVGAEVLARPAVWGNLLSGHHRVDALLHPVERRHAPARSRKNHELYLFQPIGHDRHGRALHRRTDHRGGLAGAALILYGMWRAERRPASGNKIPRPDVP